MDQAKITHAPLPWHGVPLPNGEFEIYDAEDKLVLDVTWAPKEFDRAESSVRVTENAEFIVTAVNNHQTLLDALDKIEDALHPDDPGNGETYQDIFEIIRTTRERVKGGA